MDIKQCVRQLESLKDHCRSMVDEQDPEDIWRDDVEALQFAIEVIRALEESNYGKFWLVYRAKFRIGGETR